MSERRIMQSEYMHWSKTRSAAKYNLALSDIDHYPLSEIPVSFSELAITGPGGYGYRPLLEAIGRTYGVPAHSIVTSFGTSMANHIAMAAVIGPGDEVLIEHPTYELIVSTARYLGAQVKRFHRRFENAFQIDTDELRNAVTSKTRLIVLTNLHNPSSAYTDRPTLKRVGDIAAHAGASVLVDEVYLDAAFSKDTRSSFHLGSQFIVTNSLTKVYGLSGLRCGWIFAESGLAEKMWRLIDLFYSSSVHIAEQVSVAVFTHRAKVLGRAQSLLQASGDMVNAFLGTRSELSSIPHEHGLVIFPRLRPANVETLCTLLREKYETSIVPGTFFEMPEHMRIGIGRERSTLERGLANIAKALDELAR